MVCLDELKTQLKKNVVGRLEAIPGNRPQPTRVKFVETNLMRYVNKMQK